MNWVGGDGVQRADGEVTFLGGLQHGGERGLLLSGGHGLPIDLARCETEVGEDSRKVLLQPPEFHVARQAQDSSHLTSGVVVVQVQSLDLAPKHSSLRLATDGTHPALCRQHDVELLRSDPVLCLPANTCESVVVLILVGPPSGPTLRRLVVLLLPHSPASLAGSVVPVCVGGGGGELRQWEKSMTGAAGLHSAALCTPGMTRSSVRVKRRVNSDINQALT